MESRIDDACGRDMAARPLLLSAAQRGAWLTPARSASISTVRYIEKVGDLAVDVLGEVGLRAGREIGADPAARRIGPLDPRTPGEFGPTSGRYVDSFELNTAAALRESRTDAIVIDGDCLECLTGANSASARMVSGYRPTRGLMSCTAAQEPDATAENVPGAAALASAGQRRHLPPCARRHPRRDDGSRGAAGDRRHTGAAPKARPATVACEMLRTADSPPTDTVDAHDWSVEMIERSERTSSAAISMAMPESSGSEVQA
ncbi:hypothetical protein [Nocardia nepalensis]|uniref:hypothetical protein n=1 Tax=Nocardia nepalensis TaxID=3375448 RepID=UPI003B684E22